MRKSTLIVLVVIFALLVGCATTNRDGSPKWTTNPPTSWRTYYSSGYGKLSTYQTSLMRAEAMATEAIARRADVAIQSAVANYFEEAQEGSLDLLEAVSKIVVDISLRGVEIQKRWIDSEGGVWVLAAFPVKNLKEAYKEQSRKLEREAKISNAEKMIEYLEKVLEVKE